MLTDKKLPLTRILSNCLDQYSDFIRIRRTYSIDSDFLDDIRRLDAAADEVPLAGRWLLVGRRRLRLVFRHVNQLSVLFNE
ncbi:hypothetical protein GCM10028819_09480 [Spirosoma humi]